jgi:hypothetical protein
MLYSTTHPSAAGQQGADFGPSSSMPNPALIARSYFLPANCNAAGQPGTTGNVESVVPPLPELIKSFTGKIDTIKGGATALKNNPLCPPALKRLGGAIVALLDNPAVGNAGHSWLG